MKPMIGRRKAITISQDSLIKTSFLQPGQSLPLVLEPAIEGVDLFAWASQNHELINQHVLRYGGVLFRGFGVKNVQDFNLFVQTAAGAPLEYRERSSPRTQVSGNIYTSTDYPADQPIFLHNENSYSKTWPLLIFFCSIRSALSGGQTPIADCRRVYQRIDPQVRERFVQKKVMYIRNFGEGFGLPWQTVFQTDNKSIVEAYCREAGIDVEWKDGDRLRTCKLGRAVAKHPITGEMTWFNHATFFHVTTLLPEIRDALLAQFNEADLPTNSCYGDGTPIEPEVLDHLREIYHQETISFPWQDGDILMLDNMLVAHGRVPYKGPRELVVAMAHPIQSDTLSENA